MTFETGPYIQVAAFCDSVLEDKTGALSLIRIVDRLTHSVPGPDAPLEMPVVQRPMKLVIMLKSGQARGRHELKVKPELPSGEIKDPILLSVHFEGEERGKNIIMDMQFPFTMEGLYWFHVYLNDTLITKVPFRVQYQRIVTGHSPQPESR